MGIVLVCGRLWSMVRRCGRSVVASKNLCQIAWAGVSFSDGASVLGIKQGGSFFRYANRLEGSQRDEDAIRRGSHSSDWLSASVS